MEKQELISNFKDLSKEDKLGIIAIFVEELKHSHDISAEEILQKKEIFIPIGIFNNDKLSCLENTVKYLKENSNLKFSKIAKLLNRSSKTIWSTYSNASKKFPGHFSDLSRNEIIPVSVISNRKLSTFEGIVAFLKSKNHSNHEIAVMMQRDDRTIWSIYDRAKKKNKK
ncbi:MAG TPA: hypothetical protein VJI97_03300 [Candidatus Nanoarchaeia archaeon]|nr:hypothetical protein [Candidatus Nanoarchaeia archaeon]